jgi:chaperone required for assembly of F1-ATPase
MPDDLPETTPDTPPDPFALARRDLQKSLPRRIYAAAGVAVQGVEFLVTLDGRPVRTPAKARLAVPTEALAQALAGEWAAQGEIVDPATMPLTRLVNVAIDAVPGEARAVAAEIAKYGASDLLCYRAEEPLALVEAQSKTWDPILAASEARLAARFRRGTGIIFVEQSAEAKAAVAATVAAVAAAHNGHFRLAALHVMTALTGSVLLALAVGAGETDAAEAWAAAHIDEDFQMRLWGEDEQAMARRAVRWQEMAAAALLWRLTGE